MKKEPILLLATIGTALLTGCATSRDTSYGLNSGSSTAASDLAYAPVTSPVELTKWAQDFPNMRSIDTYVFTVPAEPTTQVSANTEFNTTTPSGSTFVEAAGAQSGPERVILHRPNPR